MLTSLRKFIKTPIGKIVIAIPGIGILAGFAIADIQSFGSGSMSFGGGSGDLVDVGDQRVTETEMNEAMQRRLAEARRQNPDATYASIAGEFDPLLKSLIDQKILLAFADDSGFVLSKSLVDGGIAQLPGAQGLNRKFNDASYRAFLAQQRLTDEQVRQIIAAGLLERLMLGPVAGNARLSVGMATPYASMLLEAREGEAAAIPVDAFVAGLKPTDGDLQKFYTANRGRYIVPEQRTLRIARIDPASVGGVTVSDKEVADYYKANEAQYGTQDKRDLSQVVVQDRAKAQAIAASAKNGSTLAAAASAAGGDSAVSSLKDQTRQGYLTVAGDKAASAVFGAAKGAVVGPFQTDFGWTVVKVDSITTTGGKSPEAARAEISAKLLADKRRQTIEDLADKVQEAIDDGATFDEAAKGAGLTASTTPLITATGASLAQPAYRFDAAGAPILKTGFDIPSGDPPEVVALGDNGYALVAPGEIVRAAPPPLAKIRARVEADWIRTEATKRAKAAADTVAAAASKGASLTDALKKAGVPLPPARPIAARRIQLVTAQGPVSPAMEALFTLGQGKSKAVPVVQGAGFAVVKVDKIVPGNATLQPTLIARMQTDLQEATSQAYAEQFLAAAAKQLKIKRNDKAIAELKKRLESASQP